ncbi:ABC transporter substrate-binding protein [Pseudochrobactrum asaccharolyticum]|uniref:ABC transporter substrate-binding protein n=1 Tax=Pseudochrobactrum asaccharolyticum TaxID=354351 RepID=UPI0040422084
MAILNRRRLLSALALSGAMSVLPLSAFAKEPEKVTVALDWTVNTNHIGMFIARDQGFYKDAGLDVTILPYSDTSAGVLVASGAADFGIVGSTGLFAQRTAGADLVGTYAVVQHETGRLVFMDERQDILSPKDLDGKTYASFGSNWERKLIETLIRADGGKGEFEIVTLGTSAYEALANGAVDFTLEIATWEGVKNELEGVKQRAFRYSDYGIPDQHTTLLVSSGTYLKDNPETAKAFLSATQRGFAFAVDHPDEAADILIRGNQDVLTDDKLIRASLKALNDGHFLRDSNGTIGNMRPETMLALGEFLFKAGILYDKEGAVLQEKPDFSSYFTNDFLP